MQGLCWLERCKEPGKLEMPHGLGEAAPAGDAPQSWGRLRAEPMQSYRGWFLSLREQEVGDAG